MLYQKFLLIILLAKTLASEAAKTNNAKKQNNQNHGHPFGHYDVAAFDYDYDLQPRRIFRPSRHQQKSNPTTTPRPFVSYWQNFVRNVRLPMPRITWNMTNPLVNLFNMGDNHIVESLPVEEYYVSNSQRRPNRKRRRRTSQNKRNKKHGRPVEIPDQQHQNVLQPQTQEQILQQQYPNIADPNTAMYFYDPGTNEYYAVQRVRALGPYTTVTASYDNKPKNQHVTEKVEDIGEQDALSSSKEFADDADDQNAINLAEAENIELDNLNKMQSQSNTEENKQTETMNTAASNEESLRSILGAYMRDDSYNRQRQRANGGQNVKKSNKPIPRDILKKYYFLLNVK